WSRPDAVAGMQARVAQREAERAEALRSGKRRWRKRVKTFAGAMALALASVVSPTASAAGFGIGLGAPLEERVGGDYGPEYYTALQANRLARHRGTGRCRTKLIETPSGVRRVRRCY